MPTLQELKMIHDLAIHCQDERLKITDYTWFGDLNLHRGDIQTNKAIMEYLDCKTESDIRNEGYTEKSPRELFMTFEDFVTPILDEIPGIFWVFVLPITLISYFYQKRTMENFKEENVEYFI